MAFEIIYEQERWVGGTPASASLKEFTRLSPNDMRFSGEINDVAGWVWRRTPCLQHEISGFVTITGEPRFDSYLCKVILEKQAEESYRRRNDASRGVAWDVTDQNYRALANGYIRVADSRGPHNKDVDNRGGISDGDSRWNPNIRIVGGYRWGTAHPTVSFLDNAERCAPGTSQSRNRIWIFCMATGRLRSRPLR